MIYVKPREVAGKIMSLMEETHKRLVVVSPYNNISGWNKLNNVIRTIQEKDIIFEYYVRSDDNAGITLLNQIGITPILVPRLHAKVYFNEEKGIVSSMNLNKGSNDYSLEIAFETENQEELDSLYSFYNNYLKKYKLNPIDIKKNDDLPEEIDNLYDTIAYLLDVALPKYNIEYRIKNRNTYEYFIGRRNFFLDWDYVNNQVGIRIDMILSGVLFDFLKPYEQNFKKLYGDELKIVDPGAKYYCHLRYYKPLPERKLRYCTRNQIIEISKSITDMIIDVIKKMESSNDEKILKGL